MSSAEEPVSVNRSAQRKKTGGRRGKTVGRPARRARQPRIKKNGTGNTAIVNIKKKNWFITVSNINLEIDNVYCNPRQRFLNIFPVLALEQYLISLEENTKESISDNHIHAILCFAEEYKLSFEDLSSLLEAIYPRSEYRFNIQELKNLKQSCVYASKEDKHLLTNMSHSNLSPYFKLVKYCEANEQINYSDSLIFKLRLGMAQLQEFHTAVRGSMAIWDGFIQKNLREFFTSCPWVDCLIST